MSPPRSTSARRHDDPQPHSEGLRDVEAVLAPLDQMAGGRISVGIEDPQDLCEDLEQALSKID